MRCAELSRRLSQLVSEIGGGSPRAKSLVGALKWVLSVSLAGVDKTLPVSFAAWKNALAAFDQHEEGSDSGQFAQLLLSALCNPEFATTFSLPELLASSSLERDYSAEIRQCWTRKSVLLVDSMDVDVASALPRAAALVPSPGKSKKRNTKKATPNRKLK